MIPSPLYRFQHTDALGSPVLVTNGSRVIQGVRTEYEPYGQILVCGIADRPGYTGHVADALTDMDYMQQRYYDPMIGRFLSTDPVTATNVGGNFNRYWYGNDNPYRNIDPDGRLSRTGSHLRGGTTVGMETSAHIAESKVLQKSDKSGPAEATDSNVAPMNDALEDAASTMSYKAEMTDTWNKTEWIYDPENLSLLCQIQLLELFHRLPSR